MIKTSKLERDLISNLVSWGHWFAFFNGILAIAISVLYMISVGFPITLIGWIYLIPYTIGHFMALTFIIYLIFIFPISLILPYSKILRGYAAFVAVIALCVLLYDTFIFNHYGIHLSPFAFELAKTSFSSIFKSSYYLIPLVLLLFEATLANFLWKRIHKINTTKRGLPIFLVIIAMIIFSHLTHIWADISNVRQILIQDRMYPLSFPATARALIEKQGIEDSIGKYENKNITLTYPIKPLTCNVKQTPNVLIINVNNFRADLLTEEITPFLYQYAKQSNYYTKHFSGGSNYNFSMFSMLYGVQTSYFRDFKSNNLAPLMPKTFKDNGYSLGWFLTKTNAFSLGSPILAKDFSLITVDDTDDVKPDLTSLVNFTKWKQDKKAWFAILDLSSPSNYATPKGYQAKITTEDITHKSSTDKVLYNQYLQSLRYTDALISTLLARFIDNNTIIIITGTNGKLFTESNNGLASMGPKNTHVPLIIHWPKDFNIKPLTTNKLTSHYNLAPTLLTKILQCTNDTLDYSSSVSLLGDESRSWIYIKGSHFFEIYTPTEATVIDNQGKFKILDPTFKNKLNKNMTNVDIINALKEGKRLYAN